MGYPPTLTWDGESPPIWTWDGVPPYLDRGWGTPHLPRPGMGYPPPRNVNRQTPVKTVLSRHTTYAGGKNTSLTVT